MEVSKIYMATEVARIGGRRGSWQRGTPNPAGRHGDEMPSPAAALSPAAVIRQHACPSCLTKPEA